MPEELFQSVLETTTVDRVSRLIANLSILVVGYLINEHLEDVVTYPVKIIIKWFS